MRELRTHNKYSPFILKIPQCFILYLVSCPCTICFRSVGGWGGDKLSPSSLFLCSAQIFCLISSLLQRFGFMITSLLPDPPSLPRSPESYELKHKTINLQCLWFDCCSPETPITENERQISASEELSVRRLELVWLPIITLVKLFSTENLQEQTSTCCWTFYQPPSRVIGRFWKVAESRDRGGTWGEFRWFLVQSQTLSVSVNVTATLKLGSGLN